MKIVIALFAFFLITATFSKKKTHRRVFLPNSFKVDYIDTYTTLKKNTSVSSGTIDFLYPGALKVIVSKPNKVVFVSNKDKTWYYTAPFIKGEAGDLSINSSRKQFPLVKFFKSLRYGLVSNRLYEVKKIKDGLKIIFEEKASKSIGIRDAIMYFKSVGYLTFDNLTKMIITKYGDDLPHVYTFSNIKKNIKFKKDHFSFTPPKNTKISN